MIYVASKIRHAPRWRTLREQGMPINASWINDGSDAPFGAAARWVRCVAEAAQAHCTVLYAEAGDILNVAYAEVGTALANGKPVLAVGDGFPDGFSLLHHPLVERFETLDEAMARAVEIVADTVAIKEAVTGMAARFDDELLALSEAELAGSWLWSWDANKSTQWNTYQFAELLAMHKRRCRRWEEHHNGSGCVVERVRDKYLMPRVREYLDAAFEATGR